MRSKASFLSLLIGSFILVIAFQNCGNINESVPGIDANRPSSPGGGDVNNCLAIAVPYIKVGYLFNGSVPSSVDIDVNDELKYSDCGREVGHGGLIRESQKLEFYLGYETINEMAPNAQIKLYTRNCATGARNLIYTSSDQYDSYSMCGTSSVRLDVDYVVD
jgi:hypothetical protein